MRNFILTSSSVTDGHPDKLCDQISDAIVDHYLARDPTSRVIAECALAGGIVFVAAQTESSATVDVPAVVRETIREVGYRDPDFNPANVTILSSVIPKAEIYGRGRQGAELVNCTVFGFACDHTEERMPASIALAHRLAKHLTELRRSVGFGWLHPDGQVQVAIAYEDCRPIAVTGITLFSAVHDKAPEGERIAAALREALIDPVLVASHLDLSPTARIMVNPGGATIGGPGRHAGLTGRKNDIDCYGGYSRHGGAALSGKDPQRVDRSAAYAARYAAQNVVAAGLATECEVQLSCAIGETAPISVELDTFGTSCCPEARLAKALNEFVNFDAEAIQLVFGLAGLPKIHGGRFFSHLAAFGHFGRTDLLVPWEATDRAEELAGLAR